MIGKVWDLEFLVSYSDISEHETNAGVCLKGREKMKRIKSNIWYEWKTTLGLMGGNQCGL